ncbi:MAG: NAD-dependent DNA ligase LigA, partial [Leptospiraceae bacterium]|nr:NAD-dependent DNA ligase LigA [Leptospiraceae bacterium]
MEELAATLRYHQHKYYIENKPEISDRKFDALLEELSELEAKYPQWKVADSPTGLVGSDLESGFEKFEHTVPVLSLGNTYSTDEAVAWAEKTARSGEKVQIQWKVDGATLVLYYTKGQLTRAVTRGSGQIGDVVTNNAKTIRSIPHQLKEKVDLVARGEVYMTFADFEKFNEESDNIYANPRNLSAGSLKHKKSRDTARRPLRWVAFDVHLSSNPDKFQSDTDLLSYVNQLGLPVFEANKIIVFRSGSDLRKAISSFEEKREEVAFPVDGLVLKLDDRFRRLDLGFTAASPRWATALKFEPDLAETTVEEIEVFVGRTGRITPRARLQPVQLAGTTVTFATLHNADFIEKLGVRVGSLVRVSKRGEIIPAVEEVIDPGKGAPFKFPDRCPSCSTPLVREDEMVDWLCPNTQCPEKEISALVFFCQRKQMDMAGLGEKTIRLLYEQKLLKKIEDIYSLPQKKEALEALEGLGAKSVQIILDGIEKSKSKPFRTVMASLGMREIGPFITDVLLQNGFNSLDQWLTLANREDAHTVLDDMEGIGPDTATTILEQLKDPENLRRLNALKNAGLQMEEKREASNVAQTMEGQIWCVTGSFANFRPRDLAMDEIRKRGGRTTGSVSSKTTH